MDTEKFKEKLHDLDQRMEPQHPMFKLAKEYVNFVAFILMSVRATIEETGNFISNH